MYGGSENYNIKYKKLNVVIGYVNLRSSGFFGPRKVENCKKLQDT